METNIFICQRYSSNKFQSRFSFYFIDERRFSFFFPRDSCFISPHYTHTRISTKGLSRSKLRKKETGRETDRWQGRSCIQVIRVVDRINCSPQLSRTTSPLPCSIIRAFIAVNSFNKIAGMSMFPFISRLVPFS